MLASGETGSKRSVITAVKSETPPILLGMPPRLTRVDWTYVVKQKIRGTRCVRSLHVRERRYFVTECISKDDSLSLSLLLGFLRVEFVVVQLMGTYSKLDLPVITIVWHPRILQQKL